MSITIRWLPNTELDIDHYDIQRAPDESGVPGIWADLSTVVHDLLGTDYDALTNRFFLVDSTGTLSHWYRLRSADVDGNASGYSNPFQPSESTAPPPFANTVALYEDYTTVNSLQCVAETGDPVENAQIRVYKKTDYDLKNFGAVIGATITDARGAWTHPITVEAGFTYSIEFFKPGEYDPVAQEVVVP